MCTQEHSFLQQITLWPRQLRTLQACLDFLVEVVQGPCNENQNLMATHSSMVDSCKNLLACDFRYSSMSISLLA